MNDDGNIPEERQILFYIGVGLMVLGFLLFISVFFSGMSASQNFGSPPPEFIRAMIGMGMIVVGGICQAIGRVGLAGSGIVLDPKQQRKDLKPWSKMAGGMMNDALEEVDVVKTIGASGREIIKVRCPKCHALNDETAKFCNQCSAPL